jgi:septal ring factor EnvC (AmiA/AmiB activator)
MSADQFDQNRKAEFESSEKGPSHTGVLIGTMALVVALAGNVFLFVRSNKLSDQIAQMQDGTRTQISKLSDATTSLLDQRMQELNQQLVAVRGANDSTTTAFKRAQAEAQRQKTQLSGMIEEQQKQVASDIGQLREATTSADSKISAVSTDVSSVKTDVGSVKTDVSSVRADLASTQSTLDKTGADLKRAMGDMGVMSGLIATNGKDLSALRELGERNYIEFNLSKKQPQKRLGDITVTWKNSDPKRNRYTVEVLANDQKVQKKDKTVNEPVQLYVSGNRQPYEIVVNQVKKDEIVGYLSTPKVTMARQ